jgi:transcription termination factor Rho
MDSITKLARAYNTVLPASGKTLSGGLEVKALTQAKKIFGAARNLKEGGSLTIIATALVDTGSRMDDIIFEEFKGSGNMEIVLSRELAERRIFPAIDLYKSGTRKEELILSEDKLDAAYKIRRLLQVKSNASEIFLEMLKTSENNDEFLRKLDGWLKAIYSVKS